MILNDIFFGPLIVFLILLIIIIILILLSKKIPIFKKISNFISDLMDSFPWI